MLKFNFTVGEIETHQIGFYFNQFWGNLYITIDGINIVKTLRLISFDLSKVYEFKVGVNEIHNVKIEKIRKLFLAGFREYRAKVFIDGDLLYEFKGNIGLNDIFLIK